MTKPLIEALQKKPLKTPPLWMMRQAGRYLPEYLKIRANYSNFLEFCYTPDIAAEVTLQPITRFGFDAAIIFSDILVIPDALGVNVTFVKGEGPVIAPPENIVDLKRNLPRIKTHLEPVTKAIQIVKEKAPLQTTVIGFCGAPWTVATYMLDDKPSKDTLQTRRLAYENPKEFDDLIQTLATASVEYLSMQVEAGAEVLQIFDSWAGVVPPNLFTRAVQTPLLNICCDMKEKYPNVPIILFPRGVSQPNLEQLVQAGKGVFDGLSLDHTMNLAWACEKLQKDICLQGNLDPAILLTTPEKVKQEVTSMLTIGTQNPGYIVNLGHGITPHTPIENVEALVTTVRNWAPEKANAA